VLQLPVNQGASLQVSRSARKEERKEEGLQQTPTTSKRQRRQKNEKKLNSYQLIYTTAKQLQQFCPNKLLLEWQI
jgi:hypothetical protein